MGIVAIFSLMFVGIVIAVLWFAHSTSKMENQKELQQKKMDIFDNHFTEMVRIECPYCQSIYSSKDTECPTCGANTKKILFPEIPK